MIENLKPKFSKRPIKIIGCGLAGAELALVLARNGFDVHIFDNGENFEGEQFSYYDKFETFLTENMKFELECLDSPLLDMAKKNGFSDFGFIYDSNFMKKVREKLESDPKIQIFHANIDKISENELTVIATGHKTDTKILPEIEKFIGKMRLCFEQTENAVIGKVDKEKLFFDDENYYANLTETEYDAFYQKICEIDKQYVGDLNTQTVESIAKRGKSALKNSVLRPHFCDNEKPFASLKLRYKKEFDVFVPNFISAFSDDEQLDVLRTIKSLSDCILIRPACVKKRTFLLSPAVLRENMSLAEKLYVCGGFAGTEGSFESLLMANFCAYNIICDISGKKGVEILSKNTCIGKIFDNLLKKSVINFRLFSLKYAIIKEENENFDNLEKYVQTQKFLSKSQIEKFKEKFYGKYF